MTAKLFDAERGELMAIGSLERDGNDLVIRGKIYGAMPMAARLRTRMGIFENWTDRQDLKRRTRLRVPHLMGIPRLISATDMISIVPASLAIGFAEQYGLCMFNPPIDLSPVPVRQSWHRRLQHDPEINWLRGIVREQPTRADPGSLKAGSMRILKSGANA